MRFFKIFLVALASLVGSIGLILGVMYLVGSFNEKQVAPEAIYFELEQDETAFNFATDTAIKIQTATEDVTQTKITLSLPNAQTSQVDGITYITNGIIKVPKFVVLGQSFKVELIKAPNVQLDGEEWIVGGVSTLTAKSESLLASQISVDINVDVPVKNIEIITYANETFSQPASTFASGETFYAKANFLPVESAYKFSQDGENGLPVQMKSVFFDVISTSNCVAENQTINANLAAQGITNVKAFDALTATDELSINGYVFENAALEEACLNQNGTDVEAILAELKSSATSLSGKKELELKNLAIRSFTITESLSAKTLTFNRINKIFANFGDVASALNFGINISDVAGGAPTLQSKIKNVGVKVFYKAGSTYLPADDNQYLIVDNLGQVTQPQNGYYLPNVVTHDVNQSFWNFVPLQANLDFAFELCILNDDKTPDTTIDAINTFTSGSMQVWQSAGAVASTASWTNSEDITLTVVDNPSPTLVQSEEFDLSTILSFTPGTYSVVRYIAYTDSQDDLSALIPTCVENLNFNATVLGLPANTRIFELSNPIIKLLPSQIDEFNVQAVVLKSDYLGRLDPSYSIFSQTQPLTVNVQKTVKDISAKIFVGNSTALKNISQQQLSSLAFVYGTGDNIFDIVFTINADNKTALDFEKEIFLNDFADGKIRIIDYIPGEQQSVVTKTAGVGEYISDTQWQYVISYYSGNGSRDTEISFDFAYQQTSLISFTQPITTVEFNAEDAGFDGVSFNAAQAMIELYDGKIYTLEFAYDNDETSPIAQRTTITGTEACGEDALFATAVNRQYYLGQNPLEEIVDTTTGKFLIVAKDRFGNEVSATNCAYEPKSGYYLLTTSEYSSALTAAPTDKLFFVEDNDLSTVAVGANVGNIELGVWVPSDIETGFVPLSSSQAATEIAISRVGINGGKIQITGKDGLLSVRYATEGQIWELCDENILKYSFAASFEAYAGVLAYDEETGAISILQTLGQAISLDITATAPLGLQYSIKLTIEKNITTHFNRITPQGIGETTMIGGVQHFLMYSDNDVHFAVKVSYILNEQIDFKLSNGVFTNNSNIIRPAPSFTQASNGATVDLEFVLSFTKSQLNQQTITLSAGDSGSYAFTQNINLFVSANVAFTDNVETLNKTIVIENLTSTYDIITLDDIQRVVGQNIITLEDLTITFAKTTDGTLKDQVFLVGSQTPLDSNIFVWDNNSKKIKAKSTMIANFDLGGEYVAYFNVRYGTATVGTIKVMISTNVAPNQNSADFENRFAIYNGKLYLVLQSGETGITGAYIQSLFNNVEEIDFVVDNNFITANDDANFTVKGVSNFVDAASHNVRLTLKHIAQDLSTVAEITFGVLIAPYDTTFVKYQNPPAFEGASLGVQDLSSLNDFSRLYQFNVFDEYKSGEDANLFATNGKTFGLSQTVFSKLKDGTFTYQILMQGASGEITDVEYQGTFNKNTGVLTTIPSSDDAFVYFAIFEDVKQENLIGLYRIKLVANSAINVYYPYAQGALTTDAVLAEYVYEDVNNPEKVINFDEVFAQNLPNANRQRVQLDVWNEDKEVYEKTTQAYQIEYSLYKVDNQLAAGQLGTIRTNYGIWISGSNLNIVCQGDATRQFDIVVQCDIKMGGIELGTVMYTVTLNSTEKSLYELKLGADDYTIKTQTIHKNQTFDFSNIKLYKTEGAISSPALDVELGTHYYIQGKNATDFIAENGKALALKDAAVSDKDVQFVFFTKYGVLHTVALTFVSDYSATLATQNVVSQNANGHLEVFADTEFSLEDVFEISNANGKLDLSNDDFEYYIDGDKFEGANVVFNQIQTASQTHTLKVVAKLSQAGVGAAEDYVFEHQIDVLQSIKSNFANAPLVLGEVPYANQYSTSGLAFDKLLSTAFTDENFLFESANSSVLSGYSLAVNIDVNAFGYASLSSAESLLSKTYSYQEFLAMATNAKIYLLKSPNQDKCTVNISFILTKTNADGTVSNIESKMKFVIAPDIEVIFTYPQANPTSNLSSEHIFLSPEYFNGAADTFVFDFAGDGAAYFGTTRVQLTGAQTIDNSRIQIRATASSPTNLLIDGETTITKSFSSTFNIAWNTQSAFTGAMNGAVNFEVLIDGVSHGAYVIVFNNNIESIFAISHLKNLYQNGEDNTSSTPEQFFVDTTSTEPIFSHKTAMLSFTSQSKQQSITLVAYVKAENGAKEELGTITIGQTSQKYNWIWKAKTQNIAEDLSNVVVVKKGESKEYTFSKTNGDENSVYYPNNFFEPSATLTYRLGATYLGQELTYDNLLTLVDIKFENHQGEPASFTITRKTAQAGSVQFAVKGQTLPTEYHFEVVYDFKATNAFSTALGQTTGNAVQELGAPASISGKTGGLANSSFGISGLSGAFNAEYFANHNVEYFAQIVMITNSAFEGAPTQQNVRFLAGDKLWFMQQYFGDLTAAKSAVHCAGITLKEDAGKTYDFDLSAFGAENNGNFVYILVSYGTDDSARGTITSTNVSKFAFALIKVKVLPNENSIQLFNADTLLNGESAESNQIITYVDEKFDDILLGTYGAKLSDKNLIYIFGTGTTNLICDSTGNHPTTLELVGDIADYAYIPPTSSSSLYLKQKPGTVAMYGDKTGYIQITDMYGFEKKYYITIKAASSEDALALPMDEGEMFVGTIAGTQNAFFTAAEIVLIDAEAGFKSTELGAIKVYNLQKLINNVKNSLVDNQWTFQVSYAIPSLNFRADNDAFTGVDNPQTMLILPSISAESQTVELFILITVTHNETTEVITLGTTIQIQKRFKLANSADEKASVQAGVAFDVSKYLSVTDEANLGTSLGSASISENTLSLRVSAASEYAGKTLSVTALHNDDITLSISNINIVVGKTFDDQPMNQINGYYYYQLANHPALSGQNFANFAFTVSSTEISVESACQFVADKIISLTTSNVAPDTTVYVHINNGENAFAVPFMLNKNGVQTKSICEVTAAGALATSVGYNPAVENLPQIQTLGTKGAVIGQSDIYKFALASTPVKADELQIIKGFVIYNDSLALQINKPNGVEDLTQIEFIVTISQGNEVLGSNLYKITENVPHFRYISVYDIIKTADISAEYDVSITYVLGVNNIPSIITLNGTSAKYIKQENAGYQYALSSTFAFTEIATGKTEVLNVLTKEVFGKTRIYQTKKSYLVKYLQQNTFENTAITFNVTPKYYGLDTENTVLDKTIYANQYTVENGQYIVDFNTWTSGFNLVNLAGETLATLASEQSLVFKINDGEGQGSGAATLGANNALTTTNKYQEAQYFVIEVWVPVVEGEEICIGSIKLRIIHSQVYVATLSTYMFIITFPGDMETIEPSYTFTTNVTEIADLIFNNPAPQLQGKVDSASQTIMISGIARNISDCNIEIVTVVEQIYSAEYVVKNDAEYLELKMKLNETSSTAGKTVDLQIDATSKNGNISAESKNVSLLIKKAEGDDLAFEISAGAGTLCTRENGIYTVDIPFANIYSSIIGEDFIYDVKVLDTATTSAELLYAKRTQSQSEFALNDTLYFALSFVDAQGQEHYTILGTKFTQSNTQLFETEGYFTLNIQNLTTIDGFQVLTGNNGEYVSNVSCYSIKYLGTYDFNLSAGSNILVFSQNGNEQNFSVAKVLSYNENGAFEVSINSKEIYDQIISSNSTLVLSEYTEEVYTDAQTGYHLPKVIALETVANGYSMFSLCTSDTTKNKIVGVKAPASLTDFAVDYSWFSAAAPSLMIVDITNKFGITDLQAVSFFKQTGPYQMAVAKANIAISSVGTHTQYVFDINVLEGASFVTQIDEISLSTLVPNAEANGVNAFSVTGEDVTYFATTANASGELIVSTDIITGPSGIYVLAYQNIAFDALPSGVETFALYNQSGNLIGATCVEITQSGTIATWAQNVLFGATSAVQASSVQLDIAAHTMTYITTIQSGAKTFNAVYLDAAGKFEISLSTLTAGEILEITISTNGLSGFGAGDELSITITAAELDKTFNVSADGEITAITIPAQEAKITIFASDLNITTTANNLTILPS